MQPNEVRKGKNEEKKEKLMIKYSVHHVLGLVLETLSNTVMDLISQHLHEVDTLHTRNQKFKEVKLHSGNFTARNQQSRNSSPSLPSQAKSVPQAVM